MLGKYRRDSLSPKDSSCGGLGSACLSTPTGGRICQGQVNTSAMYMQGASQEASHHQVLMQYRASIRRVVKEGHRVVVDDLSTHVCS